MDEEKEFPVIRERKWISKEMEKTSDNVCYVTKHYACSALDGL